MLNMLKKSVWFCFGVVILYAWFAFFSLGPHSGSPSGFKTYADGRERVSEYSFPTEFPGVELGRKELIQWIENQELSASDMIELFFKDYSLYAFADLLRNHLGHKELEALDLALRSELDNQSLADTVQKFSSTHNLASRLDKLGLSEFEFENGLEEVFEDFYPLELSAYWLQQGYNEHFLLRRLQEQVRSEEVFEVLAEYRKAEVDEDAGELWDDIIEDYFAGSLQEMVEFYLGIRSSSKKDQLTKVFQAQELVFTPELERVFNFGDPVIATQQALKAGMNAEAFRSGLEDFYELQESSSDDPAFKALGDLMNMIYREDLIDRLEAWHKAESAWLKRRGADVLAVYSGKLQPDQNFPLLGVLENKAEKAQELADFGISLSLENYFSNEPDCVLVHYRGDAFRAEIAGIRYEGVWDKNKKILGLQALYGDGQDYQFKDVHFHAQGLLLELTRLEAQPEKAHILLRRTHRY